MRLSFAAPVLERDDRLSQRTPAIGQRVGTRVVPQWQTGQNAGRFQFTQAGREHIGWYSEVALQIAIALRPVEQPLHDEQGPPRSDDVEGRSKVTHAAGVGSGFIQNGE